MEKYNFKFYYGNESEQFNFYRIPKVLFTDERFAKLSVEAKVLYGLMLDRMCLSVKNSWIDEENRVYIYFKLEEVMKYLNFGKDKCVKLFSELDEKSGIGLIRRKKQGLGKPAMIYVMNFVKNTSEIKTSDTAVEDNSEAVDTNTEKHSNNADLTVAEVRTSEKPKSEVCVGNDEKNNGILEVKTNGNPTSRVLHSTEAKTSENQMSGEKYNAEVRTSEMSNYGLLENRSQVVGKPDSNDTDINNTDFNDTNSILSYLVRDMMDRNTCAEKIKENIEYDSLIKDYKREDIDGLVDIIVDTICSSKPYLVIAGDKTPKIIVADRFLRLNCNHIEYVMDSLKKGTAKVKNIKSYMLTALYNSVSTIGHYYRAEANFDMNGGTL
ncbi:MAG: replication initiator protein A [Firmicutes bacterium]|nr:replication initiator protein A [Bacillota bacterium]